MEAQLGERLRRLREERGWTVYHASKCAGMVPWVLQRLERKDRLGNVQVVTLKRLAEVYQVSLDYLVRDVPEPEPAAVDLVGAPATAAVS